MKKEYRQKCDCGGFHYLEITKWDDEADYWITLLKADGKSPFYIRLKDAFLHVFGTDMTYHDIVLNPEKTEELRKFLK